MISSYSFGHIVVDGKEYNSDIIIYPDGRIQSSWWRESGHLLSTDDISELIKEKPELIIAGTGASGIMKPDQSLEEELNSRSIEFLALPTGDAAEMYNSIYKERRVGACLHLTC